MFDMCLGFRMRIGRLAFFLAGLALSVALIVVIFTVVRLLLDVMPYSRSVYVSLIGICGLAALWAVINLYAMRVRDIGWNPAVVMPLWLLFSVMDCMVAYTFPEYATESQKLSTWAGKIGHTLFWLTLLFWPGTPGGYVSEAKVERDTVVDRDAARAVKTDQATPPSRFDKPVRRSSFGRLSQ